MTAQIWISNAWAVLALFLIPVGGGIPAGVLLGKAKGLPWPEMAALYFISDVILACVFEPAMLALIKFGRRSARFTHFIQIYKKTMIAQAAEYGMSPSPLTLILVSFGIDPMTGRTAAHMAGHGFVTGWLIAIAGDMIFFCVIMASTLWLNGVLGDGTWTAIIIMLCMIGVPYLVRRVRRVHRGQKQ